VGEGLKTKAPCTLGDLAYRWSIPLDTLRESSQLFSRHAELADSDESSDILKHGRLYADGMMELVRNLPGTCNLKELPPEAKQDMLRAADTNADGVVDFHEFATWYHSRAFLVYMNLPEDDMRLRDIAQRLCLPVSEMDLYKSMYDKFDTDGSGYIDLDEFRELMHVLTKSPPDYRIPESRIKMFWHDCDTDSNGKVDLEEFASFYVKHFSSNANDPAENYYKGIRRVQ